MRGARFTTFLVTAIVGGSAAVTVGLAASEPAHAGELTVYSCSYGSIQNTAPAFAGQAGGRYWNTPDECPHRSLEINVARRVDSGYWSQWYTQTPSSAIMINAVYVPGSATLADCHLGADGYAAEFVWGGEGSRWDKQPIHAPARCTHLGNTKGIVLAPGRMAPSRVFAWRVRCVALGGCAKPTWAGYLLAVHSIVLAAREDGGPSLLALGGNNLYYQGRRWVRGDGWQLDLDASDPSGVCDESAAIDGHPVAQAAHLTPNHTSWLQCGTSASRVMPGVANTTGLTNGPHTVGFSATNAAGVTSSSAPAPIGVDNAAVTVSLSGPTDAPTTAGTQYVKAVAAAGPSGVAIDCSRDGAAYTEHPGSTWEIPVEGLGRHVVACYARNGAIAPDGQFARSATATWSTTIREPSVIGAGFARARQRLRCHRARARVQVPGKWVTVNIRGKRVLVWRPAHARTVTVRRCDSRIARKLALGIRFGARATVGGRLVDDHGGPLAGQTVRVLTAADDGRSPLRITAVTRTSSNGIWWVRLPPGPSRIVRAEYYGSPTFEPASSTLIRLSVRARVHLIRVRPRRLSWSTPGHPAVIHITGRLFGGHIPDLPRPSKLLRIDIGTGRVHGIQGLPSVDRRGRFSITYTFDPGRGVVRFWFTVSTLQEADYPYQPATSNRVYVTLG